MEEYFLEYFKDSSDARIARTASLIGLERELYQRLKPWAENHKSRYKHTGTLPYLPSIFPDQRIDVAGRDLTALHSLLPEKQYMAIHRLAYAKAVGSVAVANFIIKSFKTTPAFGEESELSMVDYVAQCLDNGQSIAVASGHLDRLSDLTDLEDGLNIALAEEYGLKYADRFKVVVNKLMTCETFCKIRICP